MKTLLLLSLTLLLATQGLAEDYLPLETGNYWSYLHDDGAREMRVVGEPVPMFGGLPYPIEYTLSPDNQGLINYWSSEDDGGVLLWGFWRDSWGVAYQPPLRMVDAPLSVGQSWESTADFYSLPDTIYQQTGSISVTVAEDPELTVPAGVFPTFGLATAIIQPSAAGGRRYTPWGEVVSAKDPVADTWYSLGVGIVQEDLGHLIQLESYFDKPVAVETSSWGAVKALFRGTD